MTKQIDPLIVDVYAGDLNGRPDWDALVRLGPPWHGAIVKATEGTYYHPPWFEQQWRKVRAAAGERYGVDWFRGCYHFLKFNIDGRAQADYYLAAINRAGGWDVGDLWPVVDVELGGEANSNRTATKAQVIDCTTRFAERVRAETGREVVLYGNGAMRDHGITDRMGCRYLWPARYTPTLPHEIYERIGWGREDLLMWQYSGDGDAWLAGYPAWPPGFGRCDVSAVVLPGGLAAMRSLLWAESPSGQTPFSGTSP